MSGTPLSVLELPHRVEGRLLDYGIQTVEDLAERTAMELLRLRNFGKKSLHAVHAALKARGVELKGYSARYRVTPEPDWFTIEPALARELRAAEARVKAAHDAYHFAILERNEIRAKLRQVRREGQQISLEGGRPLEYVMTWGDARVVEGSVGPVYGWLAVWEVLQGALRCEIGRWDARVGAEGGPRTMKKYTITLMFGGQRAVAGEGTAETVLDACKDALKAIEQAIRDLEAGHTAGLVRVAEAGADLPMPGLKPGEEPN